MKKVIAVLLVLAVVSGCSWFKNDAAQSDSDTETDTEITQYEDGRVYCTGSKPEVCSQQYEPVCGNNQHTYSNACSACQDNGEYYTNGECTGVRVDSMTIIKGLP